jgi:hypothetical protein
MAAFCKRCGCDKAKHRRASGVGFGLGQNFQRVCPIRPLDASERGARDLPAEQQDGEPNRLIVDHSLLEDAA